MLKGFERQRLSVARMARKQRCSSQSGCRPGIPSSQGPASFGRVFQAVFFSLAAPPEDW